MMPVHAKDGDQDKQVTVKLITGTVIKGILKSFDPMTKIVMIIAGQETSILMSNVASVEMDQGIPAAVGQPAMLVTETTGKSERISIKIGQTPVEMVLVNGGRMNMGYDGDGSRKMHSEPVHEVVVTSFYISTQPLPASFVTGIVGTKNVDGTGNEPAQVKSCDDVEKVVAAVVRQSGQSLRLPTEAEWEYAASCDNQNAIFSIAEGKVAAFEWCSDYLDDYSGDGIIQTDPTGPTRGDRHVIRAYNGKRGKYDRSAKIDEDEAYLGIVRLVIKAQDIK